eukprot:Nk52_evm27s745 gene=Nk52_evmTU27s745
MDFSLVTDPIGCEEMPIQVKRRTSKKGFNLNLMFIGYDGLGKSTLINSLFRSNLVPLTHLYDPRSPDERWRDLCGKPNIKEKHYFVEEEGVRLNVMVADVSEYGNRINNNNIWKTVTKYLHSKFDDKLDQELRIKRKVDRKDECIHCCIYVLGPTRNGLSGLDIETMRAIQTSVNIVPVIGKADVLMDDELAFIKRKIIEQVKIHNIQIYSFEDSVIWGEDKEALTKTLQATMPFSVVSSVDRVEVDGRPVRARKYPWGTVQVSDPEISDFLLLRSSLFRTHTEDFCSKTNVFYENFRTNRLKGMGYMDDDHEVAAADGLKNHAIHREDVVQDIEQKMREIFMQKVKSKEEEMEQAQQELQRQKMALEDSFQRQSKDMRDKEKELKEEAARYTLSHLNH